MREALNLIAYSVMIPLLMVLWAIHGIALLFFGVGVLPASTMWHPIDELLASLMGQRLADAFAGALLLAFTYMLFRLVRDAFGKNFRKDKSDAA